MKAINDYFCAYDNRDGRDLLLSLDKPNQISVFSVPVRTLLTKLSGPAKFMKVSGFSYIRNGLTYGYPFLQSIQSLLPICDEFVVAVGDSTDGTRDAILRIGSPKIRIIDTIWDENLRQGGSIFAQQCNIARDAITGDWGFHIQADEVIHEDDLNSILREIKKYQNDKRVEGLLFNFLNFYGNYNHIGITRRWHRQEIRIIRNNELIRSYRDSQGFRLFPSKLAQDSGHPGRKLNVKLIPVPIYHYSYVRPPRLMQQKVQYFHTFWHDDNWIEENVSKNAEFDYHIVDAVKEFTGTHPQLMHNIISECDWKFDTSNIKHNFTPREWVLYLVERLTGYRLGEYKNYRLI